MDFYWIQKELLNINDFYWTKIWVTEYKYIFIEYKLIFYWIQIWIIKLRYIFTEYKINISYWIQNDAIEYCNNSVTIDHLTTIQFVFLFFLKFCIPNGYK